MVTRPAFVIGADGGGTKTLGILADEKGTELARFQVGPGNPHVVGVEGATANLLNLIAGCCTQADVSPGQLGAAVCGLAGVGSAGMQEKLMASLQSGSAARGWERVEYGIETDARVALEGAFGGEPGVVVIAGTGSNLIAKLPDRSIASLGGWGRVLGDEGSGYAIGAEAVRAVTRDIDRRGEAQRLRATFAERHGWIGRGEIIAAVYQGKFDLASLAPIVLEAAAAGDTPAIGILNAAAGQLTGQLAALVERMGAQTSVGVVFVGGLIDHDTIYARILAETITERIPHARIQPAKFPPVWGAVILAQHLLKRV